MPTELTMTLMSKLIKVCSVFSCTTYDSLTCLISFMQIFSLIDSSSQMYL